MKFFSEDWWNLVINDWNKNDSKKQLANFGAVQFEIIGSSQAPIIIDWDETGAAKINLNREPPENRFKATEENWISFVSGKFKATMGVLQGKIEFKGNLFHILPYTDSFNYLATVSKKHLNNF